MINHVQRVIARASAIDFVLAHGQDIHPDGKKLTDLFTELLIRFEQEVQPHWARFDRHTRLHVAFDTAKWVLDDLLPGFYQLLYCQDRIKWHQRVCRLILRYMIERSGNRSDGSLDALIDFYMLVWDAINYSNAASNWELATGPEWQPIDSVSFESLFDSFKYPHLLN